LCVFSPKAGTQWFSDSEMFKWSKWTVIKKI
jgi:hypothetical protein